MSSPEELVQRNVLISPMGLIAQLAHGYSNALAALDTEFILGSSALPHLSIYQAAYPQHSEDLLLRKVQEIAAATAPFQIRLGGFHIFWKIFVFWDAVKTPALTSLHQHALGALNPLREGKLLPIHEQLLADETVPAGLRESIRQYGNPLCGVEERPHLTLARLKDVAQAEAALQLLRGYPTTAFACPVRFLSVGAVGPHGTCPVLVGSFPLGG